MTQPTSGFVPRASGVAKVLKCRECGKSKHTDHCPPHRPLVCACGGTIVLGGELAPVYKCDSCGHTASSLWDEKWRAT